MACLKRKFKLFRDPKWKVLRPTICGPLSLANPRKMLCVGQQSFLRQCFDSRRKSRFKAPVNLA